ncbi:MAG: hypothetical protein PVG89_13870 [Gammaproteobacteria bacterium]|jgi:hypothetical protein
MNQRYPKSTNRYERDISGYDANRGDSIRLHLGTNSLILLLALCISSAVAYESDYLNWSYLKGLSNELAFFIGLFSIILGIGVYHFWKLGERSVYYIHLVQDIDMPKDAIVIFNYKGIALGVGNKVSVAAIEFSPLLQKIICIVVLFNIALVTFDNSGFDKLKTLPSEFKTSESEFCPQDNEDIDSASVPEGCELIIRAHKLGYAKDLGVCEPEKIDPEEMKVCKKRRLDEPYLHYMSRLFLSSIEKQKEFFEDNEIKKIQEKFELQVDNIETLRDYQAYAISAAPRASHHIWTDLPYPQHYIIHKYREYLDPNYCIERFQKQKNTISPAKDDERKNSKLLEHVYGQLLFNPKSPLTVGFCKEYKIHWNADPDICERLIEKPATVLEQEGVLAEVNVVLRRYIVANAVLSLEDRIREIEGDEESVKESTEKAKDILRRVSGYKESQKNRSKIDVNNKIAKSKQQIREKNELVSFQCFMRETTPNQRNKTAKLSLKNTDFTVTTRYFPVMENYGESQISMYKEFSKVLEERFHYSQLTSQSDVEIEGMSSDASDKEKYLEQPSYLFARLDILKNVDIFLGNSWVLDREDLLVVYPYHVHLKNYVNTFRAKYQERHGRL